jgi:hypothetical protein
MQGDINVQKFWRAAANLRRVSRINVAARGRDADHDRADRCGHTPASLVKTLDRRLDAPPPGARECQPYLLRLADRLAGTTVSNGGDVGCEGGANSFVESRQTFPKR